MQQEAIYQRSMHAKICSGLREWCSRSIGGWVKQERSLGPKSMLVLSCYIIWLRRRNQRTIGRWWLWLWFRMCVFCEWRRQLVCVLGMFVTVAPWFSGTPRLVMKDGNGGLCRSGCGRMWNGFLNGPRTKDYLGMIRYIRQEQHNWKDRWRTWCAERLGFATGGIASAEAVQRLAGKEVRNYHISSGGAGGQPHPQQMRMPWGIGMRTLSHRFACGRFGMWSRDPCSWSPKRCGATSCMRVSDATRTSLFGDVENEGEQRPACSRGRGMPENHGPTRRIWAARRTIPTLGFRRTKVLCSVQVSDHLEALFQQQRESGAPGEAVVQGPMVRVMAPSRVPVQSPGVQDDKRSRHALGQTTR